VIWLWLLLLAAAGLAGACGMGALLLALIVRRDRRMHAPPAPDPVWRNPKLKIPPPDHPAWRR
jgi:hypothetical protein